MKRSAILILLILISIGCNSTQKQNNENTAPSEQEQNAVPRQGNWEENMSLNEGRKWRVNRGTTEGINRMSDILEEDTSDSVEEYRELGIRLQEERSGVDNNRTGTDPSDDNLNIYLNPLDQKIRQLQEVQTVEEGDRLKSELEKHLYAYSNYFV